MDFESQVNSIVEQSRNHNNAAAAMRQVEAAIKAEYDPAKRAALEVTERAYAVAAMRLLQSAALDKQAAEKRAFQDTMPGWSDASYTRQPQPRP